MKLLKQFVISFFFLIFYSNALATTNKGLKLDIAVPDSVAIGASFNIDIAARDRISLQQLHLDVSGEGNLQLADSHYHTAGTLFRWSGTASTTDSDKTGQLTLTISIAGNAEPRHLRTAWIYGVRHGERIFLSSNSFTDARIKAIRSDERILKRNGVKDQIRQLSRVPAIESSEPNAAPAIDPAMEEAIDSIRPKDSSSLPVSRAVVAITVNGTAMWTDRAGNTHGLPNAIVEIYDKNASTDLLIGTTTTGANGSYSASLNPDDADGGVDLFVRILAQSSVSDIRPNDAMGATYFMESTVREDVADGSVETINLTASNTTEPMQVFSVHHALVAASAYLNSISGGVLPSVITRFPSDGSYFDTELNLVAEDRWDWDVIHHEYGHYIMDALGFENNPGGAHSSGTNLAQTRGSKDIGVRLAWGEGWPTYFAVSGQKQLNLASLGIDNVGDTNYTDTEDSTLNYGVESDSSRMAQGEDDELSTIRTLWDLTDATDDGETVTVPAATLHSLIQSAGAETLGEAWNAMVAGISNQQRAEYGKAFALNNVAPELLTPAAMDSVAAGTEFRWERNGGGTPNPLDEQSLRFFNSDLTTEILDIPVMDADRYTLTDDNMNTIFASEQLVRWVVTGKNTSSPVTPGGSEEYWSEARLINGASIVFAIDDTGSMSEEIGAVRNALDQYITLLESSSSSSTPTIHMLTFKDDVTSRITSSDLTQVRAAVASLSASGGGDCPEASAQALLSASQLVNNGGTILMATDASTQPGVDIGAVISDLRNRGVTVNTILSGDCVSFKAANDALAQQKPGDGEPALPGNQIDTVDLISGTDFIGDSVDSAASMDANSTIVGAIETGDDIDVYAVALEAGKTYQITLRVTTEASSSTFATVASESTTLTTLIATSSRPDNSTVTAAEDGVHFVSVNAFSTGGYELTVSEDEFAALAVSSVQLFSVVSAETNGTFANVEGVNFGNTEEYVSTIVNTLRSTTEPAIINATLREIPAGAAATIEFTGKNTNWSAATMISFSDPALSLIDSQVLSPTRLSATVMAGDVTAPVTIDITASTALGASTEEATGLGLLSVVPSTTSPVLLSASPRDLMRGETTTVTIQGVNTAFSDDSAVDLGAGITIDSVSALTSDTLQVTVTVDAAATIGFRDLLVDGSTLADAVLVGLESTIATIQSISPASIMAGDTATITVIGRNTEFVDGETSASIDAVTIDELTVISATELTLTVSVPDATPVGFRDLSVTYPTGVATALDGVFISAGGTTEPTLAPDLAGLTQAEAVATLEGLGLAAGSIDEQSSDTIDAGILISQSPAAGQPVPGGVVDLIFSSGPPITMTDCIDSDGDGWGWDGSMSCRIGELTRGECIDTDGDGWGWDGLGSCLIDEPEPATCIDTDGDGWGWDGTGSCRIGELVRGACVDSDGDGWGWDGIESCIP